jgi:hypothetical protein
VISRRVLTVRLLVHGYQNIFIASRAKEKMKMRESVNTSKLNNIYIDPAPRISKDCTQALDTHESTPHTSTIAIEY